MVYFVASIVLPSMVDLTITLWLKLTKMKAEILSLSKYTNLYFRQLTQ
jgi:hypothetical protein